MVLVCSDNNKTKLKQDLQDLTSRAVRRATISKQEKVGISLRLTIRKLEDIRKRFTNLQVARVV